MRTALLKESDFSLQGNLISGNWSGQTTKRRQQVTRDLATVTAAAVKDVPHRKSRMLIAKVISREVNKRRELAESSPQPASSAINESQWLEFVASHLIAKSVPDFIVDVGAQSIAAAGIADQISFGKFFSFDSSSYSDLWVDSWPEFKGRKDGSIAQDTVYATTIESNRTELEQQESSERYFEPSPSLLGLWVKGINENLQEVGGDELREVDALASEEVKQELSRQIHKIVNNYAKRKAYEPGRYRITIGGNLNRWIESLIADHLMLSPRIAVPFLDELKRQIYEQSRSEAVFKGRWGELVVDDFNELVLDLVKRRSRSLLGVLRG